MKLKLLFLPLAFAGLAAAQSWFQTGQKADLMLSGVDFNNTGGPLLFNHPSGIASDGTRFLLCDRFNNRVLIWHSLPTQWNALPDLVFGQENFTANNPGTTKSGMNWPGNVSVGANGVVAITDTENDRILLWKQFPTRNGQPADLSLDLKKLIVHGEPWPWGVWTDGAKLIACATHGATLLFWNTMPSRDDQPPDYTIALPQFGTPRNISTDGATYLFVGDHNAKDVGTPFGTFFWNTFPTASNQPYNFFFAEWIKGVKLPDGKLIAGGAANVMVWKTFPTAATQRPDLSLTNSYYLNGDGPDVVVAGGRLYVNNYNGNNVQVYNTVPAQPNQYPDFALGSPSVETNTLTDMNYIQNPVVATDGKVLIASAEFGNQLWIWKTLTPQNGQAPDVKIALRGLDLAPWDNALYNGRFVIVSRNKVAVWNSLPLNGEAPSYVLKDKIGSVRFNYLRGVALDEKFFYLADEDGTLSIWQGLPVTGNEEPFAQISTSGLPLNHLHSDGAYLCAAIQLGQPPQILIYRVADIAAGGNIQPFKTITRTPQLPLNLPASAMTFNGSFAIANTSGNAVLLWKNVADAGDPDKVIVLGQPALSSTEPGIGVNRLFMPASLAAYENFLWVGEFKFSSRILRFSEGNTTRVASNQLSVTGYQLEQNYPNPFNPSTVISFELSVNSHAILKVFDVNGREVTTLVDGEMTAGNHVVTFAPRDLAAGLYFYKLTAGKFSQTRKAVLMK